MGTCWACGVVEPRECQSNLVIRANPAALEDLSVRLCLECQIKVRRVLHEIQTRGADANC
jgi:hypothetical protein